MAKGRAEQRTNASGETVEFNEATGRWDKVVGEAKEPAPATGAGSDAEGVSTREAGTGDPAGKDGETVTSEGAATPRKASTKKD